jgi:cellulose synthase/poly-beta-1,6-N-acetylglucosamine synthase-like glycosyltransferase/exo-beta-1,3-glucanase (GH17 family)
MRIVVAVVALVTCVHAALWGLLQRQYSSPDISGPLASVSYSPYTRWQHPDNGDRPSPEQIRSDLRLLSSYARSIRIYSSTGGHELIPAIAQEFGLKVTLGIWLSGVTEEPSPGKRRDPREIERNQKRNESEIVQAIALARRYSNISAIVVGNETLLRNDMAAKDLFAVIQRVKRASPVPVTTGETWDVWLPDMRDPQRLDARERDPQRLKEREDIARELARNVDFISVHILPYWDNKTISQAVDYTIQRYDQIRNRYEGKRILVAEFGWPSAGYNYHQAMPGRVEQAVVIRDFLARAEAYGIDYNIIEAIDQPFKTFEGGVGSYWGLFDSWRNAKFAWTGPVSDPDHWKVAGLALLLGLLFSLTILAKPHATAGEAVTLAVATNMVGAWFAIVFAFWNGHYFVPGAAFALGFGILLLIPLVLIALARIEEIAAIAFGRGPRRLISAPAPAVDGYLPKVSVHIPAHKEPPEMLKLTLDAVSRLEYPNFECVVVINNTPDPAYWQPIEEHCRTLGERFKFLNVDNLDGFKAGALRLALTHTADDAEIIGVIDADYVVRPDWLKDLVPYFADQKVGMIQSPQDHRDGDRSVMHSAMNGEYAGFFDIGMVQRNEANAIIVHGTMCLIRRTAIAAAGSWSSRTIVEDTDLGLTLLEQGWQVHYTNRRYGHGLLPDTYEAFKKQRHRWAYGGFQILRHHWRYLLPRARELTRDQKREYALGWLNWLGAETLGVVVAVLNLIWVPIIVWAEIAVPDKILTIPILAAFAVSLLHFFALYRLRVSISLSQMMAAVVAAMSVQWTVARAIGYGILKESMPFNRTAKGGATRRGSDFAAFWEGVLAALLLISATLVFGTNYKQITELNIFAAVLVIQSLPFIAAVAIAALEGSRFNEFAYWRGVEAKVAETLPRPAAAEAPAQVPTENRIETVQ